MCPYNIIRENREIIAVQRDGGLSLASLLKNGHKMGSTGGDDKRWLHLKDKLFQIPSGAQVSFWSEKAREKKIECKVGKLTLEKFR